ncbi:hypothetical protein [Serratia sp. DD3]|uniref:hypothetical protein n=1 Tax=Serratia sp. DD3 TaxID=1410619 RepID=UPI0003C515C6|nr:hypothetical protein [Serratia sp. DD3]KEY59611.1 hypothetical protein SRDD_14480 [Serratia sp. DD3]
MEKQYTNDITRELIAQMKAPYSAAEMAQMGEEQRTVFEEHIREMAPCTLEGIWRFATDGALSRQGGLIEQGSADDQFHLPDGRVLSRAMVGDFVIYPDGSRARIISGSGYAAMNGDGVSFALVGSRLDNGDEIISTPLPDVLLAQWDNCEPLPDDFLVPVPECK